MLPIWTSDLPSPSAPSRQRVWKQRRQPRCRLRIREVSDPPSIYWMAPRPIVRKRHMFISASGVSPEQLLNSQPPPPSGPLKGRKRSALRHNSLWPHAGEGLPTGDFLSSPLSTSWGAGKRGASSTGLWSTKATPFLLGEMGEEVSCRGRERAKETFASICKFAPDHRLPSRLQPSSELSAELSIPNLGTRSASSGGKERTRMVTQQEPSVCPRWA